MDKNFFNVIPVFHFGGQNRQAILPIICICRPCSDSEWLIPCEWNPKSRCIGGTLTLNLGVPIGNKLLSFIWWFIPRVSRWLFCFLYFISILGWCMLLYHHQLYDLYIKITHLYPILFGSLVGTLPTMYATELGAAPLPLVFTLFVMTIL